jgi:hypothetical protein
MLEHIGWPAILTVSACLCLLGLITLFYMFAYLLGRGRLGGIRKIVAIFGTVGLVVPAGIEAVGLVNNEVAEALSKFLWPTSVVAMIGEYGDPVLYLIFWFGVGVLSSVGLYGSVGALVAIAWSWIPEKQHNS